eukprot:TRINITY_DN62980_c0_g1_i1.p1 TRINITY_DN62980_c0_g1~~TRINITY_DN62980_c0_g1_i1.p1  ORF type:complete len:374 (-),score=59.58 TRINITY_DN62980_c0_g1_i1:54-1175(-)
MACQGCGRITETRLCCPKCIELGRTSHFCGQECFTANWKAHSQFHKLISQQQRTDTENQRKPPADPLPRSTQPLPRAQVEDLTGSRGRRAETPPPLPGGTPLRSHFVKGSAAAAAAGHAKKHDVVASGSSPPPAFLGRVLGVVGLVTLMAGGRYFMTSQQDVVDELPPLDSDLQQAERPPDFVEASAGVSVASDDTSTNLRARSMEVESLRSELASLQKTVNLQDQKIRYVLARYVEKDGRSTASHKKMIDGIDDAFHASSLDGFQVQLAEPEVVSVGRTDVSAKDASEIGRTGVGETQHRTKMRDDSMPQIGQPGLQVRNNMIDSVNDDSAVTAKATSAPASQEQSATAAEKEGGLAIGAIHAEGSGGAASG